MSVDHACVCVIGFFQSDLDIKCITEKLHEGYTALKDITYIFAKYRYYSIIFRPLS